TSSSSSSRSAASSSSTVGSRPASVVRTLLPVPCAATRRRPLVRANATAVAHRRRGLGSKARSGGGAPGGDAAQHRQPLDGRAGQPPHRAPPPTHYDLA